MKKILFFLLALTLIASVSAINWQLNKTTTCSFFNMTGSACDKMWCDIQDGTYNASIELCQFFINKTIIVNVTSNETNSTLNASLYLTKNETIALIENTTSSKIGILRDSIADNYAQKSEVINLNSSQKGDGVLDSGTLIVIVIGIFAFIVVGFYFMKQKSESEKNLSSAQNVPRMIKTQRELEKEDEFEKMKKEIEKLKKPKKANAKPKKKEDEDEENYEEEDTEEQGEGDEE